MNLSWYKCNFENCGYEWPVINKWTPTFLVMGQSWFMHDLPLQWCKFLIGFWVNIHAECFIWPLIILGTWHSCLSVLQPSFKFDGITPQFQMYPESVIQSFVIWSLMHSRFIHMSIGFHHSTWCRHLHPASVNHKSLFEHESTRTVTCCLWQCVYVHMWACTHVHSEAPMCRHTDLQKELISLTTCRTEFLVPVALCSVELYGVYFPKVNLGIKKCVPCCFQG